MTVSVVCYKCDCASTVEYPRSPDDTVPDVQELFVFNFTCPICGANNRAQIHEPPGTEEIAIPTYVHGRPPSGD
jgi:hypothetical protein